MKKVLISLIVLASAVILAVPAMAAKVKPPKRVCYTVDGNANMTIQLAVKKTQRLKYGTGGNVSFYLVQGTMTLIAINASLPCYGSGHTYKNLSDESFFYATMQCDLLNTPNEGILLMQLDADTADLNLNGTNYDLTKDSCTNAVFRGL